MKADGQEPCGSRRIGVRAAFGVAAEVDDGDLKVRAPPCGGRGPGRFSCRPRRCAGGASEDDDGVVVDDVLEVEVDLELFPAGSVCRPTECPYMGGLKNANAFHARAREADVPLKSSSSLRL